VAQCPIFVSYSQSDRDIAMALVSALEAGGLPCWVAPRDVAPGADWAAEIVDAIAAARVMVLVFSASANTSPQVRREVERAVHRQVIVLPFRVADILPSRSLEYFLSSQHWLDAFPAPMEPHYARLGAYLKTLLTGNAPASAAADSAPAPTSVLVAKDLAAAAAAAARPTASEPAPSAAQLQRLERELARYIGPVARHLVHRAAPGAAGIEALIRDLGAEIESEADRREFIQASRQSLRS
jgi:TIR domain